MAVPPGAKSGWNLIVTLAGVGYIAGMPIAKCPSCGRMFHISAPDPNSWYRIHWPNYRASDFVPELCSDCQANGRLRLILTSRLHAAQRDAS